MRLDPYRRLELHVEDPPPRVLAKLRAKTRPPAGLEPPKLPFVGW